MSLTAVALGKKIQAGEVTVEEAVLDALEQIEKKEDTILSYVTVLEKEVILEKAKELKEIRSDINVELFASIFENVFLGSYLSGIVYTDGYKIEQLEREVMQIYQLIKA